MMTYEEAIRYLFTATPVFQHQGGSAYKPGLGTVETIDRVLGHPHKAYRTIHVAGTNGKGSTASTLAAILQTAGMRVGLFTSPHLVDFRERIRVNGICITEEYVVDFCERTREMVTTLHPSFFELTTMMAFDYFRHAQVDIALIEVGMGGRLDSTNIITPILSIITNIGKDHVQFLGDTPEKIAFEKAGIIKSGVPVVVGRAEGGVRHAFQRKADEERADIVFAQESGVIISSTLENGCYTYQTRDYGSVRGELTGLAQKENARTILCAVEVLSKRCGLNLSSEHVREGFAHVTAMSGLFGRWQQLAEQPRIVCDTGHNEDGFRLITEQLRRQTYRQLRIVFGMVNDKDITAVLALLPREAVYYFTRASVDRALPEDDLRQQAAAFGLVGNTYSSVREALEAARREAHADDFIFVGGSNFIVADLLEEFK